LIVIGLFFIYQQFFPAIQGIFVESTHALEQGNISPVTESYINVSQYVSNPSGLSELIKTALQENILQDDQTSLNFRGEFSVSIPSLGMNGLPVEANVDSTNEASYNKVLTHSLAHFQSTGLPISTVENNIVIYGHSASPNYNPKPTDPYVAMSFLPNIKVGDSIFIDIDNKSYEFKVYKNKIVDPTDVSIINGTKGKRTVTMFTCFPLGSSAERFVTVAREV
jgi:LPXTG-site transpeptidase (sortase) family protein